MDTNPKDETFYTTQYQQALLKYVENECCSRHRCVPVSKPKGVPCKDLFSSALAWGSGQSSVGPYHMSSDDDERLMPSNVAEMTPG